MVWSNLSLTALKYSIQLKPSSYPRYFSLLVVMVSGFFSYLLYSQKLYLFSLFCWVIILYEMYRILKNNYSVYFYNFDIDIQGCCTFDGLSQQQLLSKSRIAWWGCYLFFEDKKQPLIIYRDSVSKRDYARLCRIIRKLHL